MPTRDRTGPRPPGPLGVGTARPEPDGASACPPFYRGNRSRVEGGKRTERPRPRRWPSLACPVEWKGARMTGTEPEVGRPVLGGRFPAPIIHPEGAKVP